jgi:probable addiction module antidote protein
MAIELKPYDVAEYLSEEEDIRHYLEAAFEDGDPAVIALALGNVARARGMSKVAADAGISRAGLYKARRRRQSLARNAHRDPSLVRHAAFRRDRSITLPRALTFSRARR